jgi:hypothetical protein
LAREEFLSRKMLAKCARERKQNVLANANRKVLELVRAIDRSAQPPARERAM